MVRVMIGKISCFANDNYFSLADLKGLHLLIDTSVLLMQNDWFPAVSCSDTSETIQKPYQVPRRVFVMLSTGR